MAAAEGIEADRCDAVRESTGILCTGREGAPIPRDSVARRQSGRDFEYGDLNARALSASDIVEASDMTAPGSKPDAGEYAFIDQVIARRSARPGALLGILEEVQDHHPRKFLCRDVIRYIAEKTDTPESRIFSVVTFYALFNREPQGEHIISICRGTACHTRGSRDLLESVRLDLHLDDEQTTLEADKLTVTTADGKFTIRTVACFGQCALAPVVELDHRICGHMNERALTREVKALAADNGHDTH